MKTLSALFTTIGLLSFFGFWIVAIIGAFLILLPAGAFFFALFPKAADHLKDSCGFSKLATS